MGFHLFTSLFCTIWNNIAVAKILHLSLSLKRIRFFLYLNRKTSDKGVPHIQKLSHNTWINHFKRLRSVWIELRNIFRSVVHMIRRQLEIWVFEGEKFFWWLYLIITHFVSYPRNWTWLQKMHRLCICLYLWLILL